jgi:DNA repair protein RadD
MNYKLREYQEECVQKGIEILTSSKTTASLIVAPTGSGKSLIISELAKRLNSLTVVLQPSKELLEQNYAKYISYGLEASIYSASLGKKELDKQVIFATIGSIIKDAKILREKGLKYVIVDEAHRGSKKGSQLDKFKKETGVKNMLGLSATPVVLSNSISGSTLKMQNKDYTNIFKSIGHVVQIQEMTEKGFWTPLEYKQVSMDLSNLRLNSIGTEFTTESVTKNYIDNNLDKVIKDTVSELEKNNIKSILVFCPSVKEAVELQLKIKGSQVVYGDMNNTDRDRILEDFKQEKFNVLINCQMLQIGYDNPNLEAVIMATPTNSVALYYQILGRVIRIKDGKEKAQVIDLVGNVDRFGRIEDFTFEDQEYTKGWAMFSGEKVLTNFPLGSKIYPTRKSLKGKLIHEKTKIATKFYFGKYKNQLLWDVYKKDKGYLIWLINNKEFTWFGVSGENLKKEIYNILSLEQPN